MSQNTIKVWDPLIRVFHWSLVVFFTIAFLTGEEEDSLHAYAGYVVIGLVIFRILWGFIGPEHARFKDFVFGPAKVIQYLKSLASGSPQRYVGHNPAGGYMVVLMLATLLVVTFTGLKAYAAEGHGPLAANAEISVISFAKAEEGDRKRNGAVESGKNKGDEYWEEIHEAASNFMLGLIVLHILGVVVYSRLHKENLVKAMITGEKDSE
ncbi:cytochrome b/b6 domain-containing protein [Candidatus Nitrotoga sp. 1052]|uniref:cytochrome b/b6 domain-containing protein n=1 Tax=Candidatus Nitrotoga sp. 1052 TaxID=2886964 RepID=UPI001EF519DF|nr:cytochrome b/b6 domain-containing protein [Candidatus Nitrotoga sp. 1052]CAH1081487.1 Cytochrome b [Candidatus Nitrotoga sp. 1052]